MHYEKLSSMNFIRKRGRILTAMLAFAIPSGFAASVVSSQHAKCFALLEPITQMYSSARPGPLDGIYKNFYHDHYGLKITAEGDTTLPYLSSSNLIENIIETFLRPGEPVAFHGSFLKKGATSFMGRPLHTTAKLVFIRENSIAEPTTRALVRRLLAGDEDIRVVVIRPWKSTGPRYSYLSDMKDPRLIEVHAFAPADTGLANDVYFLSASPEDVWRILETKQHGSQFFGPQYGIGFGRFAERIRPTRLPENIQTLTYSDVVRTLDDPFDNAPGFRHRDVTRTFDLGTGQPNVPVSPHLWSKKATLPVAKTTVTEWYFARYGVKLNEKNITFSQGVSSSLGQIFGTLKPGSVVALPSPSYYVYHELAHALGVQVKLYDAQAENLAKTLNEIGKVDLVLVNFPHNPTGRLLDDATRKKLQAMAEEGMTVVNDLSYPLLAFDGKRVNSIFEGTPSQKNLIEILGSSKDIGLPEERIAAIIGDEAVIARLRRAELADVSEISGNRLGVFCARLQDLKNGSADSLIEEVQRRRDYVIQGFRNLGWPEKDILIPEGGLNVLLRVPKGMTPSELTLALWTNTGIYVSPGNFLNDEFRNKNQWVRVTLSESSLRLEALPSILLHSQWRHPEFSQLLKLTSERATRAKYRLQLRESALLQKLETGDANAKMYDVIVIGNGPHAAIFSGPAAGHGKTLFLSETDDLNPDIKFHEAYSYFIADDKAATHRWPLFPGASVEENAMPRYVPRDFIAQKGIIVQDQNHSLVLTNTGATGIIRTDHGFEIQTKRGIFTTKRIVMATGQGSTAIPDEFRTLKKSARFFSLDEWMSLSVAGKIPDLHKAKVAIIGGSDGGLSAALTLAKRTDLQQVKIFGLDIKDRQIENLLEQDPYFPIAERLKNGKIESTESYVTDLAHSGRGMIRLTDGSGKHSEFDYVIWAAGRKNPNLTQVAKLGEGFTPLFEDIQDLGNTAVASSVLNHGVPDPDVLVVGPAFVMSIAGSGVKSPGVRLQDLGIRTYRAAQRFFSTP